MSSRGMSKNEIEFAMQSVIAAKADICDIPSRQSGFSFRELCLYYTSEGYHLNEFTMERSLRVMESTIS